MKCSNCKAEISDTAKFCGHCGTKVGVRLCPNGHVLDTGSYICKYCPTQSASGTRKVSASTTVEKTTTLERPTTIEKSTTVEKPTTGDTPARHESPKTEIFQSTRLYTAQEMEPVKLMGWLVIVEGKDHWKDFRIMKTRMSIGRDKDCDIVIDDSHISSKQASIRVADDIVTLTDLDSSNGTYVNDQEITKIELKDNDIVKMGNTTLKFKAF
jgi:hypothetical protein